jgi:2-keto-3-deoxy-L-rhamnonate aldolase RhmA
MTGRLTANITKERLQAGKVAFGLGVRFSRTIDIARAAASSGYHYLFIDLEHSVIDLETASQICIAALDAGVTPLVRVPGHDYSWAGRILDGGAQGIVVPHVNTPGDAKAAIDACKYPPVGHRSSLATAVQAGWSPMSVGDVSRFMNDNILMTMLIETPEAIENVEAIAAVDGVDVLSVGSNDLALEMGIPGDFDHPQLLAAYARVVAAAHKHGKAVRLGGVYEQRLIKRSIELGSRMVTLGNDFGFMLAGMRAKVTDVTNAIDANLLAIR